MPFFMPILIPGTMILVCIVVGTVITHLTSR
jgi:hypothetical protein